MHVECVEQKCASAFTAVRGGWQARRENEDMVGGGREEVGRGAAGRCGMGVWWLVGGCGMAWIGEGAEA